MNNIMRLFLILGGLFLLGSCSTDSTDLEKYNKKLEECFEDKQDELDTKYADMDEAIAAYEFDIAHKFLGCYKTGAFYEDGSAGEWAGKPGLRTDINPRLEAKQRLVKAETSYLMKADEFDRALRVYEELFSFETMEGEYYMDPSFQTNSNGRYQIYYKAVYHYSEEGDRAEATKWAKRAPSDVSVDGYLLNSWNNSDLADKYGSKPPSQMEVLLKEIENY